MAILVSAIFCLFWLFQLGTTTRPSLGGDGQPARQATLATPTGLALDEECKGVRPMAKSVMVEHGKTWAEITIFYHFL